ncbi:DUF1206 domain-containing protein [Granulicoccus phenolivorans]|uniref:DUF1206 domain-containing protein n=1 Tax=Granulicoccus phenolivorans TaxID=266854 RepID=UPI0004137291|nr:DUF1206 domain-containing protein [Granulicoccus phenolivorans]
MGDLERQVERTKAGVSEVAEEAGDSKVVTWGARAGYVASGLIHLLIAWIAVSLALGLGTGQDADQAGAFAALVGNPVGLVLMLLMVAGLALLAVLHLTKAIRADGLKDRLSHLGNAAGAVALIVPAVGVLVNRDSRSAEQTQQTTSTILSVPFGFVLILIAGAVLAGIGVQHIWTGLTRRFTKQLVQHPGRAAIAIGTIGYLARGIALLVAGFLIGNAAITGRSEDARGMDGAFRAILAAPWGQVLVLVLAAGFACYAVYCFIRARYARV